MPGRMGPVTVFFMPGEMADTMMPVASARFNGEIIATHWGSIAVVGEAGESVDGLGERLAAAVRWRIPYRRGRLSPLSLGSCSRPVWSRNKEWLTGSVGSGNNWLP